MAQEEVKEVVPSSAPTPSSTAAPTSVSCASSVAASATAPAATSGALFKEDAVADARAAEALKEERRRRLRAMQLELETEKQGGRPAAPAVAPAAPPASASVEEEEEEDPLDAFMKTHVLGQAEKEAERAAAHQKVWQAQYGHKAVILSDQLEPEYDANKHCYVCKKWGHTKKDCPHKRCRFCGKEGPSRARAHPRPRTRASAHAHARIRARARAHRAGRRSRRHCRLSRMVCSAMALAPRGV